MSQENVEIVRRLVEGGHEELIGQGDYSPLLESIDPEIEVEAGASPWSESPLPHATNAQTD